MDSLYNIEGIMNKFLQLPVDTRRTIYEQVSLRLGIDDPKAIEKDIWVTGILQAVYTLPYADKLVFKGGSSLSKVWNLISRFSEDIDLAIDRSVFGLEGDLTKKQLKKLRKASSLFVKEVFAMDLQEIVNEKGLTDHCTIMQTRTAKGMQPIRNHAKCISLTNRSLGIPAPIICNLRCYWKLVQGRYSSLLPRQK